MELTFPFKNLAYNNLLKLFDLGSIREYCEEKEKENWTQNSFNVGFYRDMLPSFENEILQIIETTNQETIDYYFINLRENITYLKSQLDEQKLLEKVELRNNEELEKFNEIVSKNEKAFLASPMRQKKHLETYEQEPFYWARGLGMGLLGSAKKKIQTNYNYYCIEEKLSFIDPAIVPEYFTILKEQANLFIDTARKYGVAWQNGEITAKEGNRIKLNSILFCEGDIDIDLIRKAAELLGKIELLAKFDLRQRGSCSNLDKLWALLTDNNWETVPQTKILLYDCDTNRPNEDFGHIYRRTIPKIEENIIQKGIENLFTNATMDKAIAYKKEFVDFKNTKGTVRGVPFEKSETTINKDEKRNFSNWIIKNGNSTDFTYFEKIFEILKEVINKSDV